MKSSVGNAVRLTVFGESHGAAIGAVIEGLPAGVKVDIPFMEAELQRRAPGRDKMSTPRREEDEPEILSGIFEGVTTGAPLAVIIRNNNTKSGDYEALKANPRPSHSDYAAYVKYDGMNDIRGGGHFSGRLTAPIVAVGAICKQILKEKEITVGGHINSIGTVVDTPFDYVNVSAAELTELQKSRFPLNDKGLEEAMRQTVQNARMNLDSVGGSVELAAVGMPAGIGNPMFSGVENVISCIIYGIPAVKSVSFGAGERFSYLHGSEANDDMYYAEDGRVCTYTNNCGGITGGITNGMPIIVGVTLKPTPSIAQSQNTVNLKTGENVSLDIKGRHDPCIVPRALPALEAALAIALCDLLKTEGKL